MFHQEQLTLEHVLGLLVVQIDYAPIKLQVSPQTQLVQQPWQDA